MLEGKVLITGGTGTLGNAILRVAQENNWPAQFTIVSRSWKNLNALKAKYPEISVNLCDVCDYDGIRNAISGHDLVIHAAAMKHVVNAEVQPDHTFLVNVTGSQNVVHACAELGVEAVFISTDKAANPANAYGASKLMMEKIVQQYAGLHPDAKLHLVRYGNVLGSAGSFILSWWEQFKNGETIIATHPDMSRFWLSEEDAVQLIVDSVNEPSGTILVPLLPSASMRDIADWLFDGEAKFDYRGIRPGEKLHETLVTREEFMCCDVADKISHVRIFPTTVMKYEADDVIDAYTSDDKENQMTKKLFQEMVREWITP